MTDHPWSSRVEPGAATHTPCCPRPQSEHPGASWEMVAAISAERDRLTAELHAYHQHEIRANGLDAPWKQADCRACAAVLASTDRES